LKQHAVCIVLAVGLLLSAIPHRHVVAAAAQSPSRYIGQETVGEFRSWGEAQQVSYVMGVYSFAIYTGLWCPIVVTVGEYKAALLYNRVLADTDSLPKAMLALFVRNGCVIENK
jgi:hypothetical protein